MSELQLPDKLFFKIGEVAQIIGVRPHVLRYWETEFAALRPMKTRGAHRVYRRRDVELAMLVKRMLQDEGLTIAGAKRRLREIDREREPSTSSGPAASGAPPAPKVEAAQWVSVRADMLAIRRELADLLKVLDAAVASEEPHRPEMTATVTASVPSSVPLRGRR
jgi:DNA-binding transcriptional MerR regulator